MKPGNLTRLVFISAFFFYGFVFYSQTNVNANELDKKYAPNTASIFNNSAKKSGEAFAGNETDIKNVFKFSPTLLFRQRVVLFYEREIFESVTGNIGIGKPFGNDVFQKTFFSFSSSSTYGTFLTPYQAINESVYWGSWPTLSAGAKIYFSGSTFDQGYIEFNYRWERTDYLLNATVDGKRVDGENDLRFMMNAFNFGFGYTGLTGSLNNFTHDFYCNFGLKLFKYTAFDQNITNSVTGSKETVYRKTGSDNDARILPSFNFGYVFGFGF